MIKDILDKAKQSGKKVDGLGEDALATVGTILEGVLAPITTQLKTIGEQLTAATAKNAELEGKVGELAKAPAPAVDPKSKKDEPAGEEPAWAKELREENKKLRERLDGRDTKETVSKIVSDTINTKFGNHRMKAALIEEATERGYTKAEDVIAFVEKRNKQLVDSGVLKPEQLVADPAAEDAKKTDTSSDKTKEQAAIKKIKEIGGTGF